MSTTDQSQNYKILLTGTYSSFNKGDAAMQLATAHSIRKQLPSTNVTIATPFPHYDNELYGDFSVIKTNRRNLILATIMLASAHLYTLMLKININVGFLLFNKELQTIQQTDVVVDLSGDTITEDYGPHVTYSHLLPILLAQALDTPVYICAQSMGPFKITKWLVKQTLSKCAAVVAREEVTFNYLEKLLDTNNLYLKSDMAFLLEPAPSSKINAILKKEEIEITNDTVCITISNIIKNRYTKETGKDFDGFFANTLDAVIDRLGANILFVGHVTGPDSSKDDRLVAKNILDKMKNKDKAKILLGDYTPQEIKGIISRCRLLIGARMHSNIAGISSFVPTVAMSYSHKTIGIMKSVNLENNVVDGAKLSKKNLLSMLQKVNSNHKMITKMLKKQIPVVQSSSQENISNIFKILEDGHL